MENTLVIVDQPAELAATLELAADFARASKAKTTLTAYGSDWRLFNCWCEERGLGALAASPEVVCGFLADEATRGRRASTLEGAWRPSATSPGLPGSKPPTGDEKVKAVLSGIRRTIGAASVPTVCRSFWSMTVNGPMTHSDRVETLGEAKAQFQKSRAAWAGIGAVVG